MDPCLRILEEPLYIHTLYVWLSSRDAKSVLRQFKSVVRTVFKTPLGRLSLVGLHIRASSLRHPKSLTTKPVSRLLACGLMTDQVAIPTDCMSMRVHILFVVDGTTGCLFLRKAMQSASANEYIALSCIGFRAYGYSTVLVWAAWDLRFPVSSAISAARLKIVHPCFFLPSIGREGVVANRHSGRVLLQVIRRMGRSSFV